MRVVLDACVPQQLRKVLPGHVVQSAQYARLGGLSDKELVLAADALFDVLVTCDHGLRWQQNLSGCAISVLILKAPSNRFADLKPLVPAILRALQSMTRGTVVEITQT